MNKGIAIHIFGTFIYLACFLYVSDGVILNPIYKIINVIFLISVNLSIAAYCDMNDLYKNK